jgi:magnesium transporter
MSKHEFIDLCFPDSENSKKGGLPVGEYDLNQLIEEKRYFKLRNEFQALPPVDIAEFLEDLEDKSLLLAFRLLPKEIAADVFSYLSANKQAEISGFVNEKELKSILDDLYFDDKIDFLEELPANVVKKILLKTTNMERAMINRFLMYPEHSAGSIMTIELIDLKKDMSIAKAIEYIRRKAPETETVYTCYVTDAQRRLEGMVSLKDLIIAKDTQKVEEVMESLPYYASTLDDQEEVAAQFKKYDLIAGPVVDKEQRLVGLITIDDIVDVIQEENTEDFHKMAAITPTHDAYITTNVFTLAGRRILWLLILMISATLTGMIINRFESALEAMVILVTFIPMIMGTGGNAGAQASTLIIRSIVLGEIKFQNFWVVFWKEFRVGLVVGVILSVFNFLRIFWIGKNVALALTVAITLLLTILIAKTIGGLLPLIVRKIGLDPAIMASPILTTIIDALALIIYFYIAIAVMRI